MRLMAIFGQTLSAIRAAIAFLTRIPVGHAGLGPSAHAGAAAHFPLVGALLGALGAGVWLATPRLDPEVRAWLVIAALLLVTGAFHEDGLADTADALGGACTREKLFEILKDSRIGAFGAVALICVLVVRAKLLAQLLPKGPWLLVAAQAYSRLAPVLLMAWLPYVTPEGSSRSRNVTQVGVGQVVGALFWTVLLSLGLCRLVRVSMPQFIVAVFGQAFAVLWLAYRFKRRAGGLTGDFLGATQQIGELAFLLGASITCPSPH
jgi:adenosylcobinamide-GDP ribazoletransferase